jgi:uncharacterized repeat protein (TIGR03803 family)
MGLRDLLMKFTTMLLILASVSLVNAQTIQPLFSFPNANGYAPGPRALTLGTDGNFYSTTQGGGNTGDSDYPGGMGTIFKITTNGTFTPLVNFNQGAYPSGLILDTNTGNFYGTTMEGGYSNSKYTDGMGTVFMVTPGGDMTPLAFFTNSNGAYPSSGLTLGKDGNFYGTTENGGNTNVNFNDGYGVVFRMTPGGVLTNLVNFDGTVGQNPNALTLNTDGSFYGTANIGGSGSGTVFKATTNGVLSLLASFNGNNGELPNGPLVLGTDGNFYGTTESGGNYSFGTVFKVTTGGSVTTLYSFSLFSTNGGQPYGPLTLGTDGNFYGTTSQGGNLNLNSGYGYGTVFRITTNGTFTTLASFNGTNGASPQSALTLDSYGNIYGTTVSGGSNNVGTVFALLFPAVITVQPQSQTNYAGSTATFLVSATGLQPMSYQWQKNGTNLVDGGNISGSTNSTLSITGISENDGAVYSVIITNPGGNSTSSNATLTVNVMPFIASQPQSQTAGVGSTVTFSVTAYGALPFVYQWYFNNAPLGSPAAGTNIISYTLTDVETNQAGDYSVQIFNDYNNTTSSNAVLKVIQQPTLALHFLAGYPLLNLNGALNNNYVVQYSTNLAGPNWINLLSVTNLSASPYQFLDSAGLGQPTRFYRTFIQ